MSGVLLGVLGGYLTLSTLATGAWVAVVGRIKRQRPTYTNLTLHLPPVPELDWLDDLPCEVLSPREVALRCERLERAL